MWVVGIGVGDVVRGVGRGGWGGISVTVSVGVGSVGSDSIRGSVCRYRSVAVSVGWCRQCLSVSISGGQCRPV